MKHHRIALGFRPKGSRHIKILGVKSNLCGYTTHDRRLIDHAEIVFYPTRLYAQPFENAGKKTFPSPVHYFYMGNKIRQTQLFELCGIPHPKTMILYGRHATSAAEYFSFPFIAKIPVGSGQGRGVYLIKTPDDYRRYLKLTRTAYIQEKLSIDRDLRVVVIAGRVLTAYWRIMPEGEFRSNVRLGGIISFKDVPEEGVKFAADAAMRCGFDDVGLDVCFHCGKWMVLEANMHYGLEGLHQAGLSVGLFLDQLIEDGII